MLYFYLSDCPLLPRYSTTPNIVQIASWVLGRVYDSDDLTGTFMTGQAMTFVPVIPASMAGVNSYGLTGFFEQSKPQYNDVDASIFYSVKEIGATGLLPIHIISGCRD